MARGQDRNTQGGGPFQTLDNMPQQEYAQRQMRRENSTTVISNNAGLTLSSQRPAHAQGGHESAADQSGRYKSGGKTVSIQGAPGMGRQKRPNQSIPNPGRPTGPGMAGPQGSRFRVAVPLHVQPTPHSQATQQRFASNQFWNQVANHIGQGARQQARTRGQPGEGTLTGSEALGGSAGGGVPGIGPP